MEAAGVKPGVAEQAAASETAAAVAQQSDKKQQTAVDAKAKQMRTRSEDKWKIFSGTANDALAKEVCDKLGLPLGQTRITKFSDGETYVQIEENVRGADVFMVQPTCDPVAVSYTHLTLPTKRIV